MGVGTALASRYTNSLHKDQRRGDVEDQTTTEAPLESMADLVAFVRSKVLVFSLTSNVPVISSLARPVSVKLVSHFLPEFLTMLPVTPCHGPPGSPSGNAGNDCDHCSQQDGSPGHGQDSFDDHYLNCGPAITEAFPALNDCEFQVKAEAEWRKRGSLVSPLASPAQAVTHMAYTTKDIYKDFNAAVHAAGCSCQEYWNNFHSKMLHFLLTQALLILRHAQNGQCHQVFRGVHDVRLQAWCGQKVQFGQFTFY
ncbi:hypothetical protein EK904_013424 [Melospiza melodia maxima]|nr:hypothetical protein EK904_013424 [Melospiza melodia maxima]